MIDLYLNVFKAMPILSSKWLIRSSAKSMAPNFSSTQIIWYSSFLQNFLNFIIEMIFVLFKIGSPTALADDQVLDKIKQAARKYKRKVFVPSGAFWGSLNLSLFFFFFCELRFQKLSKTFQGAQDIRKMADAGSLKGLRVTMRKHPDSLKLENELKEKLEKSLPLNDELVVYEGAVKELCRLAPNNVNTMAVGAICAHNLGFDKVQACLVADPK